MEGGLNEKFPVKMQMSAGRDVLYPGGQPPLEPGVAGVPA